MNWQSEIPTWCNSTHTSHYLTMDQACLNITNQLNSTANLVVELWAQSQKCEECPMWKMISLEDGDSASLVVNTTYATNIALKQGNSFMCNFVYDFGEFGTYVINIASLQDCPEIIVQNDPANIYLPLLWTFLVIVLILTAWGFKCILQHSSVCCRRLPSWFSITNSNEYQEDLVLSDSTNSQGDQIIRHRIRSLDAFRGFTIISMILINYGGGGYWFLKHSPWNGLTPADVIFPWFVWIMGASCVLSLNSQLRRALSKKRIFSKIVRRSSLMFLLGVILNSLGDNNIERLRFPGVLQRLSFVYIVVASLELLGLDPEDNQRYTWFASVRDILCSWWQWIVVGLFVAANVLITFLLAVPGCPLGYLGAGGLEKGGQFANCTGGAARYVDQLVFGSSHIHQRPTTRAIYNTSVAFDPEGILGSLTCVLCAYLGAEAGKVLLYFHANRQRVLRWMSWSLVTGLIGGALCTFSINGGPIPINKNLWSVSYVLVTSSMAFSVLTVFYVFIDALVWWSGAPLRYAGMNAVVLYVGHMMARPLLPFSWSPISSTHCVHLAMNTSASALWILISWILYRKRLFLTL